jgi:aspartyl-tRNA(Asn)/glutamyl-tRNA(Gln) amidotransferase subunit A
LKLWGARIVGKTHMHQLAYGITGENPDFGDMLQPANPTLLTGGSSSGAAASVQDGSARAAIATDTGGSVRVPAALCGLCGYRSSIPLNASGIWRGGYHLAPSFDTVGWIYSELADGPLLGQVLFDLPIESAPAMDRLRIGTPDAAFLHDCDPTLLAALETTLAQFRSCGASTDTFDAAFWEEALSIYSPIVAYEAAKIHHGHFSHFDPVIAQRLHAGAHTTYEQAATLYAALDVFRERFAQLWERFDTFLLPCAPITELRAGEDTTAARGAILRYTTPVSLAGAPAVTLPNGLQLVGPLEADARLLTLSTIPGI